MATGTVFRGSELAKLRRVYSGKHWPHLQYLQEFGLIDRKPSTVRAGRDSRSLTYQAWPLVKMADGRWPQLEKLLVEHGALSPGQSLN